MRIHLYPAQFSVEPQAVYVKKGRQVVAGEEDMTL